MQLLILLPQRRGLFDGRRTLPQYLPVLLQAILCVKENGLNAERA